MKVMCINDDFLEKDGNEPKVGEIVTVVGICQKYKGNYFLLEYPRCKQGIRISFRPNRFAPISDIDEKELIKERELVNA